QSRDLQVVSARAQALDLGDRQPSRGFSVGTRSPQQDDLSSTGHPAWAGRRMIFQKPLSGPGASRTGAFRKPRFFKKIRDDKIGLYHACNFEVMQTRLR